MNASRLHLTAILAAALLVSACGSTTPSVPAINRDRLEIDIPTRSLDRRRAPTRSFAMASIIAGVTAIVVLTALFLSSRGPHAVSAQATATESSSPNQGLDAAVASAPIPAAIGSESEARIRHEVHSEHRLSQWLRRPRAVWATAPARAARHRRSLRQELTSPMNV